MRQALRVVGQGAVHAPILAPGCGACLVFAITQRYGGKPEGALVGGPSGPMLLSQIAASRPESLGPEGPPTNAETPGLKALPEKRKAGPGAPGTGLRTKRCAQRPLARKLWR
ncbi:DUF6053 domain-containing protein [Lysobacter enzymogenes]|uniref:DUF6053 domain-containing protein n=1 Tax=Lysobacter enzymogenes TaxID=69 RepID=UPI003CCDDB41